MPHKSLTLLDRTSLDKVHRESLRVLENIGVRIADAECIRILKKAGAKVFGQTDVVRLPAPMVMEAVDQVIKEYDLVSPSGDRFKMPSQRPMLMTRVKMPWVVEYGTLERRLPCRQDVINLCQIANALPEVRFCYAVDYPSSDVPSEISIVDTVGLMLAITGKPGVTAPISESSARTWIDMSIAATGSDDLDHNPGVLLAVCTTGPLQLEAENGKIMRHAVGRGVPIAAEPMPMAGASAPFTLAGTLLMGNAEALFLFTLANAIRPGAKVAYGALGSIMNLRSANISMGAPETMLMSSAEAAMARFYGLPTYRPTCFSDACYPDIQAGIEKAAFTLMVVLGGGADLVMMGGSLSNASSLSYEQVVIDHDVWEMVHRCMTEITVNDATLAYEAIARVGVGGTYLADEHTLGWMRSGEHYYGGSYNRTGKPGQDNSMLERAHRRVAQILSQPAEYRAPSEAIERIKQYVRDEAKFLGAVAPAWAA